MASKKQEVVKQESGGVPAELMEDMLADSGQGSEEVGKSDLQIPFISVLQKLSPQCDKEDPAYVEGAEPGMFYNNLSEDIIPGNPGMLFVPVHYTFNYIEYIVREEGGGFVADHGNDPSLIETCSKDEKGRDILPSGNQLVATGQQYIMVILGNGKWEPAIFPLTSTKLKHNRRLNSLISQERLEHPTEKGKFFQPARWYRKYLVSTAQQENKKGKFYNVRFSREEPVVADPDYGKALYADCRAFYQALQDKSVKVDHEAYAKSAQAAESSAGSDDIDDGEDIPF